VGDVNWNASTVTVTLQAAIIVMAKAHFFCLVLNIVKAMVKIDVICTVLMADRWEDIQIWYVCKKQYLSRQDE